MTGLFVKRSTTVFALSTLAALGAESLVPSVAQAAGIGNLTYTAAEVDKPVSNFGGEGAAKWASGPSGSNTALMLRNVFIVMGSKDSGAANGSFHIYDLTDPRKPKLLKTYDGTPETQKLRELHAMPVAIVNGKDYLVFPTTSGLQFFDFTDPMNPTTSGSITLDGLKGGDYDSTAWMLSWQWPYVFAGCTGSGVYVVDATDPAHPTKLSQITTGELGNFRVGPTFAAGNYLVVANMDQTTTHFSVLDVGDPKSPFLLSTGTTTASLYSSLVVGDRIYGAGTNGDYVAMKWSATGVSSVAKMKSGSDRGGYCTFQSSFLVCGQSSEGYKKWDMHNETAPTLVGHGTDPNGPGGDFDFATIMGNLVYLGNDHGSGAALIPHQAAADTVAPQVVKVFPSNGDTKQALSTRVTVFFSEDIDIASLSPTSLLVRKNGGAALEGVFSKSSFNAISIGFKQPLTANTTYEVVVPAMGLKDLVGNPITEATTVRFSTGPTVDGAVVDPAGGSSAGGGSSVPQAGSGSGGAATGGTGGTLDTGGASPSAGATAAGGFNVAGAAPSAGAGGALAVAGTSGLPQSETPAPEAAGCGCALPGHSSRTNALLWLPALALGAALRRARRQREATRE
jgi:MYXO-CTERM domain-containing protein